MSPSPPESTLSLDGGEPLFLPLTEEWWSRLPRVYRLSEGRLGFPLKRWMSLLGDEADGIAVAARAIVTDPATSRPRWLPWIAQLIGIVLDPSNSVATQRAAFARAERLTHGSAAAIIDVLGRRWPGVTWTVTPHWGGDPWVVMIESPTGSPALTGSPITTFAELQATFATFAEAQAAVPTFADLSSIDRIHVDIVTEADVERPAGVRIYHRFT